jgi:hypothetical protein
MEERLQKILARAGFGSRRACEELIRQGRVTTNGKVAQMGQKANPDRDRITVDGKPVELKQSHTYVALHKPWGVLSDEGDGSGHLSTVRDLVLLPGKGAGRSLPAQGHERTDGFLLEGSWAGHFMMIGKNILYGMAVVVSVTAAEAVSSP